MPPRIPTYDAFFNPVLQALNRLGGSATIAELEETVAELMRLSTDVTETPHGDTSMTEVGYRIAWARTYLKKYGLLENSQRGVWSLTQQGRSTPEVDTVAVRKRVKELDRLAREAKPPVNAGSDDANGHAPDDEDTSWEEAALAVLKSMDAAAFERLCQRLLRESGFIEVEVTGKSADGGIDGRGVLRLGGLISFTVMFQAKRYKDTVGSNVVRDFRGALMGRADKGLIITTGRFTNEANKEAIRDGATPIDLIDGSLLVAKLRDLRLGISTRMIERVEVDHAFFDSV